MTTITRTDTFSHLSTGHLTPAVREALTHIDDPAYADDAAWRDGLSFLQREYGWFMYVRPLDDGDANEAVDEAMPQCLIDCFNAARADGASWILFDVDEDQIDALPWYAD